MPSTSHRSNHRSSSPLPPSSPLRSSSPSSLGKHPSDDDSDESEQEPDNDAPQKKARKHRHKKTRMVERLDPALAKDLEHLGKAAGRFLEAFDPFEEILRIGLTTDPRLPDDQLKPRVKRLMKTFESLITVDKNKLILNNLPQGIDDLSRLNLIAASLETGRGNARTEDVQTLKTHYPQWKNVSDLPASLADKATRFGFHNYYTGRRLCPPDVDWDNEEVQRAIIDGDRPKPDELPRFIWKNGECNPENILDNLLMEEDLVVSGIGLLIGPSVPKGNDNKSRRQGRASLAGIKHIKFPVIAYITCLYHFLISSQTSYSPELSTSWPYPRFYRELLKITELFPEKRKKTLLDWWTQRVFGHIEDEDDGATVKQTSTSQPKKLSLAERVRLAAQKEAEIEAKELDEVQRAEKAAKKAAKKAKKQHSGEKRKKKKAPTNDNEGDRGAVAGDDDNADAGDGAEDGAGHGDVGGGDVGGGDVQ